MSPVQENHPLRVVLDDFLDFGKLHVSSVSPALENLVPVIGPVEGAHVEFSESLGLCAGEGVQQRGPGDVARPGTMEGPAGAVAGIGEDVTQDDGFDFRSSLHENVDEMLVDEDVGEFDVADIGQVSRTQAESGGKPEMVEEEPVKFRREILLRFPARHIVPSGFFAARDRHLEPVELAEKAVPCSGREGRDLPQDKIVDRELFDGDCGVPC
jgi:hypothetical protein